MPKKMKRPRLSGKKASDKIDTAHDKLLDLITLQLQSGEYEDAQQTCRRLLASESLPRRKRGAAYRYLGNACALSGAYESAFEAYSDSLRFVPERADVWINRSQVARQLGQIEMAVADLEHVQKLADESDDGMQIELWLARFGTPADTETTTALRLLLI